MAQPVKVRRLTDQEGQKLQRIVRRGSTGTVRYRRAMMLPASAGGNSVPVIARLVQADEDTVRDVIHRFNEIGLACLDPQWAGDRPRLLTPDDEDFVVATATTRPTKLGKPFTRWSVRKLADYWAPQGKPDPHPATYHRTHGTTYFHGCYSVGDDTLWGVNRRRKGITPTWAALRTIRAARPDGAPIYVILDNLSAHKNWRIRRWAKKNKVELCFTPTNASWANPIEAHFGPLRQFTLANSHHPNHTVQTRELRAHLRWRNQNARHPDILAAQRRERARVRSEKGIRWGGRPLPAAA
ncbi:helix-turn-helix domain-containing protein [Streptomyces tubercidicus]|uniref:helix-turn-helix domain-containing protein n=1 Tax=Streptomyces tubercidicus TaxID=47759 RepID=UPI0030E4FE48